VATPLPARRRGRCRHDAAARTPTGVPGLEAQEVEGAELAARPDAVGSCCASAWPSGPRPAANASWRCPAAAEEAEGKSGGWRTGEPFQALVTALPRFLEPGRRLAPLRLARPPASPCPFLLLDGRAEPRTERNERAKARSLCPQGRAGGRWPNPIMELAGQFGLKSFCCRKFRATEAACQPALAADHLGVLFQRHLGQTQKVELQTLRFRLFSRAALFSHAQGRPTLKFALPAPQRACWRSLLEKLPSPLPPRNRNSVGSLAA